jgi:hypothetical protein
MGAIALDFAAMSAMTPPPMLLPQRPEMAGLVKRVWLLLYSEGGRWTEAEIRHRLHIASGIHTALREMVERGFLVRSKVENIDGESSVQYGVGRKCKVPRGVVLEEIEQLLEMVKGKPGAP